MARKPDKELEEFRNIMIPADHFEEGFGWRTVVGAVFLGFIMMPASMYAGLVVGGKDINQAARWVTVILFMEVAKRSLVQLSKQQVFVLYYMSGMVMASPFQGLLWNQYLVQSDAAMEFGMVNQIPSWVAPQPDLIQAAGRTFMSMNWLWPIALVVIGNVVWEIDRFGLGYFLYRLTSDAEKLPFPMAPVGASGAIALAESTGEQQTWRWRLFSIGTIIGILWGIIYFFIPSVTNAFLGKPVQLIPLPWIELTPYTSDILPGVATGIIFSLSAFMVGMVLPFWAIMGSSIGLLLTFILNPLLQTGAFGKNYLPHWNSTMTTIDTMFYNGIDFYMSLTIGVTFALAFIGMGAIAKGIWTSSRESKTNSQTNQASFDWQAFLHRNKERGDLSIWLALGIYIFSTTFYTTACLILAPGFPWYFLIGYAFIYTPLISYATARLEGTAGQALAVPYVKEISFVAANKLTGYEGINIWFTPIPIMDYGRMTVGFRQVELTGTKFTSIIKTEFVVFPIIMICSIIFSQLIWKLAAVPSDQYPFAQKVWPLQARNSFLMYTATTGAAEDSAFYEAIKFPVIFIGFGFLLSMYAILYFVGAPIMLVYGLVRGITLRIPHSVPMEFSGAMLGHFVMRRKFGAKWRKFAPILFAGVMCGQGLVMASSVALTMIAKAVSQLAY